MERVGYELPNQEIRLARVRYDVPFWRIAQELGVADTTFCKWLRTEFNPKMRQEVLDIIIRLSEERKEETE